MKIGVTLRNMGPQSTAEILLAGARFAETIGFESIWITDHIAIPPDDAEGSGGRYTDPLTTLAWLGGATSSIKLGVGVLVVPYRSKLPLAKAIATTHELTGNRLLLGCAVGWMDAEFKALGLNRHSRGVMTDEFLQFLEDCFEKQVVEQNDQPFIFNPRPEMPPVYIGGSAPHALKRAVKFGHGWLPMMRTMAKLKEDVELFRNFALEQNKTPGPVTVMTSLPADRNQASDLLNELRGLQIERLVCACRYNTSLEYQDKLLEIKALAL